MKKKFVILSVSALLSLVSLAGCGQTECPVCEEKPGEDNPGGDNPGTDNPGEDHPGTDEPGTDPEPEPDPSEGLIDEADSPWDEETTKLMMSSLGGGILPYVNLGEGALDAEFVKNDEDDGYRSYLKITGSSYLESSLDAAVTEYKDHYWDALMVGENFYATNDLLKVEVEVGKTYDGLFELKAFYNEPFDSSKVDSWDENTTKIMSEHLGRFTIPFVYLGTVNYETEVTAEGAILVTGGTWNDLVLAEFDNAFDGWEVTNPDMEDLTTTLATKTEENGNKVSVTLSKNSFGKAQVLISLEEAFDSTNQTAWSTEVLSAMDKSLNTNILPYVYLGTVYPTVDTANTSERNITIVGKLWDDSILTAAKKAFEKDSTLEGDETWEIVEDAENSSVTFTRDIGLELYTVVIGKNTDGVPTLQASREEGYHPESLTDYTEEIKTSFQAKFGEEVSLIPYIYLGTASPRIDEDLSAAVNGDNKIVIRGGKYDERILTQFTEQFASQNGQNSWYIATDCFEDRPTGSVETDGEVLVVALKNTGEHTYKVGLFTLGSGDSKTVYLEITRANNTGAGASEWSAESLANLKTVLGSDVTIPHFEMGKDSAEIIFNDYGQLEIDFSSANLDTHSYYMWCVIDALSEAKWNVALGHVKTYYHKDAWLSNVHAEKTFGTKKVSIDIDMHQSSYYGFFIDGIITSVEEYDSAKETGTWNDAVKQEVKDRVGLDLPYIYLGTDNPYAFYDEDDEVLKIYGNATSDRLYENANTVLTNAGYTIYDYELEYHYIVAETKNEAGNIVTITIEDDDDRPCISFEYTEVFNPGDRTEWDADTKAFLEKELPTGVKLPYMYLGKEKPTTEVETFNDIKKIAITGGNWDDAVLPLIEKACENSQFTATATSDSVYGYTLLDDNTAVRFILKEDSWDPITLTIYVDLKPEDAVDEFASWSDFSKGEDITKNMESELGETLPEFLPKALLPDASSYLSFSSSSDTTTGNKYVSLSSYYVNYKPYYLYVAMNKLKAEGFKDEDIVYNPFANGYEMPQFTAKKEVENGTLVFTLSSSSYARYDDDENGLYISAIFLPKASSFEGAATDFGEDTKTEINNSLGFDLPYVNLGCEEQKVSTSSGSVEITGYNYSEEIIENIKKAYENNENQKWVVYDTYVVSNGKAYKTIGGHLELNGHIYQLTVTPSISGAFNGNGTFSGTSCTTIIQVTRIA